MTSNPYQQGGYITTTNATTGLSSLSALGGQLFPVMTGTYTVPTHTYPTPPTYHPTGPVFYIENLANGFLVHLGAHPGAVIEKHFAEDTVAIGKLVTAMLVRWQIEGTQP